MLIIRDLLDAKCRFCDLERSLEGISTRTLTLKLRRLEQEKLIRKSKDGCYEVTAKGKGLRTVETAMRRYGEKYL
jgi:DNA-binding HxlR family transcriptional regulator